MTSKPAKRSTCGFGPRVNYLRIPKGISRKTERSGNQTAETLLSVSGSNGIELTSASGKAVRKLLTPKR